MNILTKKSYLLSKFKARFLKFQALVVLIKEIEISVVIY